MVRKIGIRLPEGVAKKPYKYRTFTRIPKAEAEQFDNYNHIVGRMFSRNEKNNKQRSHIIGARGNTASAPGENSAFKFTNDMRRKVFMKKKARGEFKQFVNARENVTKQYNDIINAIYSRKTQKQIRRGMRVPRYETRMGYKLDKYSRQGGRKTGNTAALAAYRVTKANEKAAAIDEEVMRLKTEKKAARELRKANKANKA